MPLRWNLAISFGGEVRDNKNESDLLGSQRSRSEVVEKVNRQSTFAIALYFEEGFDEGG